jgi:hypothetical protein
MLRGACEPRWRFLCGLGIAALVYFIAVFYYFALGHSMASYDARAIWSFKAVILAHDHSPFIEVFQDPFRVHYHRDYPLLVPLMQYTIHDLLGHVNEDVARILFTTIHAFFILYLVGILQRVGTRECALLFGVVFAAMPLRQDWLLFESGAINSGDADVTLSFFAVLSVYSWLQWWSERRRSQLLLAGLFVGCALMTKKEGMVVLAAVGGANGLYWLLGRVENRLATFRQMLVALAAAIVVALPWRIALLDLPNLYDEDFAAMFTLETASHIPGRLRVILLILWDNLTSWHQWNATWFLYAGVLLLSVRWWIARRLFLVDAVIVLWLAAYIVVYLFSPLALTFHLGTSLRRLLSHFFPFVLMQVAFFWALRGGAGSLWSEPILAWKDPGAR